MGRRQCPCRHGLSGIAVAAHGIHGGIQRLHIPGRHQQSGLAIIDEIEHAPQGRGHDRDRGHLGFDHHSCKAFRVHCGVDEDIGGRIHHADVFDISQKKDVVLERPVTDEATQLRFVRSRLTEVN